MKNALWLLVLFLSLLAMTGCSSSDNAASATYSIGGTVSGLTGSGLVLQNNEGNDLAVSANGAFTFTTSVAEGGGYAVTVKTHPSGPVQTCLISNGSGTVSGSAVADVTVTCAVPGSADTTFGTGGMTTTSFGSFEAVIQSVAIQADGKIVVVGNIYDGSCLGFALARYNTDGSPDTTFGTDGVVNSSFGSGYHQTRGVAIQADDGRIVVAGSFSADTNYNFALARYNTDGSRDTTFGTGGIVIAVVMSSSDDGAESVAIQSDGKIVAAGYADFSSDYDIALVRCNTDGSLDTTFGTGGIVTTNTGLMMSNYDDYAYSVAVQSDGKIVVAGSSANGSGYEFMLARYNADGSLNTAFGTDGIVTTGIGSSYDYAYSVAIQADGKIVAAGSSYNGSNDDFALARYNADGSLDTTFSGDGMVTTGIGSSHDYAKSVAIQADGKIVAAGRYSSSTDAGLALARYNAVGTLDTTFGTGGIVTTDVGSFNEDAYRVALQTDGKIVTAGYFYNSSTAVLDFAVIRFWP